MHLDDTTGQFHGPGYPFDYLLKRAPEHLIRALSEGTGHLVEALSGRELSPDERVRVVLSSHHPPDLLRDENVRRQLLQLLPPEKAKELSSRLGYESGRLEEILREIQPGSGSVEEEELLRFFGYAEDHKRSTNPSGRLGVSTAAARYGLFRHQRGAVRKVLDALSSKPRRVVLHMPTGAGKTRCAMHLLCRHLREEGPTLVVWLAYNQELLDQAAEEFETAWRHLGDRKVSVIRYWGSADVDPKRVEDGVIVAGLAKMHRWSESSLDEFLAVADRTTLTVMDEAHQSTATTYRQLLDSLATKRPDAALLGLTATPGRTWADIEADRELSAFFAGKKVMLEVEGYGNPVEYLMSEGYLARPRFVTLKTTGGTKLSAADLDDLRSSVDIPAAILERLADSETRTLLILRKIEELLERHDRLLVFATTVAHAQEITAVLKVRGYDAECLTGATPKAERQRFIRRYRSNRTRPMVLVNYGVLTAGFDAPKTSAALIARPTRSLVLYSQMVGRATRGVKAGGSPTCEIVTVVDPDLPGFGDLAEAFTNWEDVWT